MNNRKSSIFNLKESQVTTLIWVFAIAMSFYAKSIPTIIIIFLILKFERKSARVRNHAGQALIASIVAMLLSFGLNVVTSFLVIILAWIPIINATSVVLAQIVRSALNLIIIAYFVLGLLKALQQRRLHLPIIGSMGDQLTDSIQP